MASRRSTGSTPAVGPIGRDLLDLLLPGIDGLSITRRVRQTLVPIVMSTADRPRSTRCSGSSSAPRLHHQTVSMAELQARNHAILRASNDAASSPRPSAPHPRRGCRPAGRPGLPGRDVRRREVILTREFDLLFARHQPDRVSAATTCSTPLGRLRRLRRDIDTLIQRLRRKLGGRQRADRISPLWAWATMTNRPSRRRPPPAHWARCCACRPLRRASSAAHHRQAVGQPRRVAVPRAANRCFRVLLGWLPGRQLSAFVDASRTCS